MANISRFFWAAATAISSKDTPLVTVGPEREFTARLASLCLRKLSCLDHWLLPVCLRLELPYYSS